MTEPLDIEQENPNPDEATDDGLGTPPPPEVVTDADVDEGESHPSVGQDVIAVEDPE